MRIIFWFLYALSWSLAFWGICYHQWEALAYSTELNALVGMCKESFDD